MNEYKPELGQLCFGQPSQNFDCPEYIEAALEYLANFFYNQELSDENPFRNTGYNWSNDIFDVRAYDWNEEHIQSYNFKYKDIEISWYKYLGRGMSINRFVSEKECWEMLKNCIQSLI